ncbi:DnaJ-like protein [Dimargaris xerosporica]|nr:DnaJ-like protein [Dimargaris xerosporica]
MFTLSSSCPNQPLSTYSLQTNYPLGTDNKPCDTEYYELLQVSSQASADEIKQRYYHFAMSYHPNSILDSEDWNFARDLFKAYHVLSDATLRQQYNTFGLRMGSTPSAELLDIRDYLHCCLGGDQFVDLIGEVALPKRMQELLITETLASLEAELNAQTSEQGRAGSRFMVPFQAKPRLTKRQRAARKKQHGIRRLSYQAAFQARVAKLAGVLLSKLSLFTDSARDALAIDAFQQTMMAEASELIAEMNGACLLALIGKVYLAEARQFITDYEKPSKPAATLKCKHMINNVKIMYSLIESMSLSILFMLTMVAMNQNARPMAQQRLDNDNERAFIDAFQYSTLMDVENAIRMACDQVLNDSSLTDIAALHRAQALEILGNVYTDIASKANAVVHSFKAVNMD